MVVAYFFWLGLLCLAPAAQAAALPPDGFYIGFSGRYENGTTKNATSGVATNFTNFTVSDTSSLPMQGFGGGFFGGYTKLVGKVSLGLELEGDLSSAGEKKNVSLLNGVNSESSLSGRKAYMFSLCVRLGVPLGDQAMAYIKGGVGVTRYRFGFSIRSDANGVAASSRWNQRLTHLVTGAGIERKIETPEGMPEMRLGMEYEHVSEKDVRLPATSVNFRSLSRFSPGSGTVSLRLIIVL